MKYQALFFDDNYTDNGVELNLAESSTEEEEGETKWKNEFQDVNCKKGIVHIDSFEGIALQFGSKFTYFDRFTIWQWSYLFASNTKQR